MDALRKALESPEGSNHDEERGILEELDDATTLSWSTRIKCFLACYLLGSLMSFLSPITLYFGPRPFPVLYTLGNLFNICSTMFLMGPLKQLQNIFAPTRLIASIIVVVTFILTVIAALVVESPVLALLMVMIQSLAMTWYSMSYIPFARDAVKRIATCFF